MKNKQKPGLMIVLRISTDGLIPAILKRSGFPDVLVWVSEWVRPDDGRAVTAKEFHRQDPELWIAVSQLQASETFGRIHFMTYQEDEWLISDTIPQSRVVEVLPCQGPDITHNKEIGPAKVRERANGNMYRWSWRTNVWKRSTGRLHAKIGLRQKRSWDAHELDYMKGVDWSAKAQRRDYKGTRRNRCWVDPETMTTTRNDMLSEDCDGGDGRSKDQELSGKDSEQFRSQDEAEKWAMIAENPQPLENTMTEVDSFHEFDDDSWNGFSDEDSASRRSPV